MAHETDPTAAALAAAALALQAGAPLSTHLYRIAVGGLGGVAAACVKYLSHDQEKLITLIANNQADRAYLILYSLLIIAAVLFFLGGLVGWASSENNGLKLLALGISAPALFTTWSGKAELAVSGAADKVAIETHSFFIQTAQAGESLPDGFLSSSATDLHSFTIFDGIKDALGLDPISLNYWVVAGSYLDEGVAKVRAKEINLEDPTMKAFVGKQRPGNKYFPVIVGEFSNRDDAEKLLTKALKLQSVAKAYLSDYADRKP